MTNNKLTYLGITASASLWRELGHTPYTNAEFSESHSVAPSFGATDGDLIYATITTGDKGDHALAWLIVEKRQRQDEYNKLAALKQQSEDALHVARINRQTARLNCKLKGIDPSLYTD